MDAVLAGVFGQRGVLSNEIDTILPTKCNGSLSFVPIPALTDLTDSIASHYAVTLLTEDSYALIRLLNAEMNTKSTE